jgi:predicted dehydrogenase
MRVARIGCGLIGAKRAAAAHPHEIAAVCDHDQSRAGNLARQTGAELSLQYAAAPTYFWKIPVDDNCFLALRTAPGQMAWLHASWTEWKNIFSFEIAGRDGKLVIEGIGGSYGVERLTFYQMLPEMGPPETTTWEFPFQDRSWAAEFADFAAAIRERRRPCGDIHDAVANLEIIEKVYKSCHP